MIGQTLAHYRITAAIGAGGMGEVYRATDTKLGRDVALKVLPAEMASNPERLERFRREAKALAALDHPGIVTRLLGRGGGRRPLPDDAARRGAAARPARSPRAGCLVDRLLEIATALAEALAAAHDKGIVHRDLKPANVMVSDDGRVKVLDFGLAQDERRGRRVRRLAAPTETPHARGRRDGDRRPTCRPSRSRAAPSTTGRTSSRSGVILYEMASGRRPFQGRSSAELVSAILRDTPPAAHRPAARSAG